MRRAWKGREHTVAEGLGIDDVASFAADHGAQCVVQFAGLRSEGEVTKPFRQRSRIGDVGEHHDRRADLVRRLKRREGDWLLLRDAEE